MLIGTPCPVILMNAEFYKVVRLHVMHRMVRLLSIAHRKNCSRPIAQASGSYGATPVQAAVISSMVSAPAVFAITSTLATLWVHSANLRHVFF